MTDSKPNLDLVSMSIEPQPFVEGEAYEISSLLYLV